MLSNKYQAIFLFAIMMPYGSLVASSNQFLESITYTNQVRVESLSEIKFRNIIKQELDYTCGIASLRNIFLNYYNITSSEGELISIAGIKPEYSLYDLSLISKQYEINTTGVKLTVDDLDKVKSPTMLYIKRNNSGHFVILKSKTKNMIKIIDPAWGYLTYTTKQFSKYWVLDDQKGRALIFTKKSHVPQEKSGVNTHYIHSVIVP